MTELLPQKSKNPILLPILFLAAFFIWLHSFKGFLLGSLELASDAVGYYNHFKFFVENLKDGIFPLWDYRWNHGVPNEFFLRRIGSFNPLYFLIVIPVKLGVSFGFTYMVFLSLYWFLGCYGFFLLSNRLLNNCQAAFFGFLILYFSSLGNRIFDSYIILVFVPMVWFFFFCVSFANKPRKFYFVGIIFTLMILLTTYVPFYFLIIATTVFCFWTIFYFKQIPLILKNAVNFIKKNTIVFILGVSFVGLAFIPGIKLMKEGKTGEIVLPSRNYSADSQQAFEVGYETTTQWAILEEFVYASAFINLKDFKFAVLYAPIILWVFFLLGVFSKITRLSVFLSSVILLFLLMGTPGLSPVYDFLRSHVFVFKYFRNLHFFLWLAILPALVCLVSLNIKSFLENADKNKILNITLVIFIFGLLVFGILKWGVLNIATVFALLFSLAAFLIVIFFKNSSNPIVMVFMFAAIIIEPIQAYHYLQVNRKPEIPNTYKYVYDLDMNLAELKAYYNPENYTAKPRFLYYSTRWFSELDSNINWADLHNYVYSPIAVYDRVEIMRDDNRDYRKVEQTFRKKGNTAFVLDQDVAVEPSVQAQYTMEDFEIVRRDTNSIQLKTNFKKQKFLVFNDSFSRHWKALIDGQPVKIHRANIAFKGVVIPEGAHEVLFRYGGIGLYLFNYLMMFLYAFVFGVLVFYGFRMKREVISE